MLTTIVFPFFVPHTPEVIATNVFWLLIAALLASMFLSTNAFVIYFVASCSWLYLQCGARYRFFMPMIEMNVIEATKQMSETTLRIAKISDHGQGVRQEMRALS